MIASIKGTVSYVDTRFIIVDVQGVGYKVFITEDTLHSMKNGSNVSLWTHLAVREDAMNLYGFVDKKEKDFFELLISISGIGPKGALNILSTVSSDTLVSAIRTGSTSHLVKVSGIGRKTAEKIVMELRDKLGGMSSGDVTSGMSSDMDAIEAMKALGYEADDAREALKKIDKEITDTGAKVKAALKMLN